MILRERAKALFEIRPAGSHPGRLEPVEGLRGIAVLLVFFVHYHALFGTYAQGSFLLPVSRFLGNAGNAGVDLFFVLSGYLIYGGLISSPTPVLVFLRRRVLRIYPAFLVVLGVYVALSFIFPGQSRIPGSAGAAFRYILANVLLLPGVFDIPPIVTVAWSLSYEFAFYLTIPLIVAAAGLRGWPRSARLCVLATVFAVALACSFSVVHSHARLLMFVPGMIVFEWLHPPGRLMFPSRLAELICVAGSVATLALTYLIDCGDPLIAWLPGLDRGITTLPGVPNYQGPYKVLAFGPVFLLLLFFVLSRRGLLAQALCWTPLRCLGNMSYSYFLIHGLALHATAALLAGLRPSLAPSPLLYVAVLPPAFLLTLASGALLFATVEKPMWVYGRSSSRRSAGPSGTVTSDSGKSTVAGALRVAVGGRPASGV